MAWSTYERRTYPVKFAVMSQENVRRAEKLAKSKVWSLRTHLNVKLVPRLGPFKTSIVSKKAIASGLEWNVTEKRPP